MSDRTVGRILALVPYEMRDSMQALESTAAGDMKQVSSIEELIDSSVEGIYAVALIPATGFTSKQWWSVWGCVHGMEPRPSILVYALQGDFELWSSVLDSGGYDVVVAPFTAEKLSRAIAAAAAEFLRQRSL